MQLPIGAVDVSSTPVVPVPVSSIDMVAVPQDTKKMAIANAVRIRETIAQVPITPKTFGKIDP